MIKKKNKCLLVAEPKTDFLKKEQEEFEKKMEEYQKYLNAKIKAKAERLPEDFLGLFTF